jgi:hypothetical protein
LGGLRGKTANPNEEQDGDKENDQILAVILFSPLHAQPHNRYVAATLRIVRYHHTDNRKCAVGPAPDLLAGAGVYADPELVVQPA